MKNQEIKTAANKFYLFILGTVLLLKTCLPSTKRCEISELEFLKSLWGLGTEEE
jgi:hypothetical protein